MGLPRRGADSLGLIRCPARIAIVRFVRRLRYDPEGRTLPLPGNALCFIAARQRETSGTRIGGQAALPGPSHLLLDCKLKGTVGMAVGAEGDKAGAVFVIDAPEHLPVGLRERKSVNLIALEEPELAFADRRG